MDWQLDWLGKAFAPDIIMALLTCARKGGKTGLIGSVILAHVDPQGPFHNPHFRGVVCSETGRLAGILRDAVGGIARSSGIPLRVKKSPLPGTLEGLNDERVEILAADRAGGHGQSANLAIIDDAGVLGQRKRALWESIATSVSATPGGRCFAVGVRSTGPMFAEYLDMAKRGVAGVVAADYSAPMDAAIDDPAAWEAANPGLGFVKRRSYMKSKSAQALETPAAQVHFRLQELNQPLSEGQNMICTLSDWQALEVKELPERSGKCYIGLDLGSTTSWTAATLYWPESGRLVGVCAVGREPDLAKRGRADGKGDLYVELHKAGELLTIGGPTVEMPQFMERVYEELGDSEVGGAGCDKHRIRDLERAISGTAAESWPWSYRGTGFMSFSHAAGDVRAFQECVARGLFSVARTKVWLLAIEASKVDTDKRGNQSLNRQKKRARQDLIAAGVIAAGLARDAGPDDGDNSVTWV